MKYILSILFFSTSVIAMAETDVSGHCQTQAEARVKGFLEAVLKTEWGWQDVKYVNSQVSLSSYKVVKNPHFNVQKHEDYVFEFKSTSKVNAKYAVGSRLEVQMFANEFEAGDEFTCYTNSFRLVRLQEGIEL